MNLFKIKKIVFRQQGQKQYFTMFVNFKGRDGSLEVTEISTS